jgi:hypothetical protein
MPAFINTSGGASSTANQFVATAGYRVHFQKLFRVLKPLSLNSERACAREQRSQKPHLIVRSRSLTDSCVFTALMMSVRNQGKINCVSGSLTPTRITGGFDATSPRVALWLALSVHACVSVRRGWTVCLGAGGDVEQQPAASTTRAAVERKGFMR